MPAISNGKVSHPGPYWNQSEVTFNCDVHYQLTPSGFKWKCQDIEGDGSKFDWEFTGVRKRAKPVCEYIVGKSLLLFFVLCFSSMSNIM